MARKTPKMNYGFYYSLLDMDQQLAYKKLGLAIAELKESVVIRMEQKKFHKVFLALSYDNPEFFYWVGNTTRFQDDELLLSYEMDKEEAYETLAQMRAERDKFLENLEMDQVISTIYKKIKEGISYAYSELEQMQQPRWINTIAGVLLHKKAVCLGIAQAVNYMLSSVGIPSILVTGRAEVAGNMESHAWNLVEIEEGKYRHLDVTAEICECKELEYKYFLLQDWEVADRKMPEDTYPPAV